MFSRTLSASLAAMLLSAGLLASGCGGSGGGQNAANSAANSAATAAGQAMNAAGHAMTGTGAQAPIPAGLTCKTQIVWVNLSTRVYHEQGDPFYGRTKNGEYMCLAEANLKGYHLAGSGHMTGANSMSNSSGSMGGSMTSTSMHHHHRQPNPSST